MAGTGVVLMSCNFCNMMGAAGIDVRRELYIAADPQRPGIRLRRVSEVLRGRVQGDGREL